MKAKGHEAQIILEGASVKLITNLGTSASPLTGLWNKSLESGLVAGFCKACSAKLGVLDTAVEKEMPLLADMSGHPSMAAYRDNGYEIVTF